jgi:hypothetical protein
MVIQMKQTWCECTADGDIQEEEIRDGDGRLGVATTPSHLGL